MNNIAEIQDTELKFVPKYFLLEFGFDSIRKDVVKSLIIELFNFYCRKWHQADMKRFVLTLWHFGLWAPYGDIDLGKTDSDNGLLPDGTKPLSEPMLTNHQQGTLCQTDLPYDTRDECTLTHCGLGAPYGDIDLGKTISDNGLLPDGTKPLSEPMLTNHQQGTLCQTDLPYDTRDECTLTHCGLGAPYDDIDLGKTGSGNGLLPDGTKPLLEPMLTNHQQGTLCQTELPYDTRDECTLTHCGLGAPYGDIDLGKTDSDNGLLPDGTKPLSEPMLTNHQQGTLCQTDLPYDTRDECTLTHCGLGAPYGDIDLGKTGSGNGLLPDGTKPLPEPMLPNHQ